MTTPPRKRPANALDRQQRLFRLVELLQAQPREATAVSALQQQLAGAGLEVERRTLERDLRFLEQAVRSGREAP